MDLTTPVFLNSTLIQWLVFAGLILGSLLAGFVIYRLLRLLLRSFARKRSRLITGFDDVGKQLILIVSVGVGIWQGFRILTPTATTLAFARAFAPVLIVLAVVWIALRFFKLFTPDTFAQGIVLDQFVPILVLLVALFWLGRFFITRPLTCVPSCAGRTEINADLSDLFLQNVTLSEANLRGADLSNSDLSRADLSGANLATAILRNANLSNANLVGADLSSADLRGAILENTDLRGATLDLADLTEADLTNVRLRGATLVQTKLVDSSLTGLNLAGVSLTGANLTGSEMTGVTLNGSYLSRAEMSDATLTDAELTGALLNLANLTGADLREANLAGASFIGADLTSADFTNSKLVGATLIGANMGGAQLLSADLSGTRLLESEFLVSDTRIDNVLLTLNSIRLEEVVTDANLRGVSFNAGTMWPEGRTAFLSELLGETATLDTDGEEIIDEAVDIEPDFLMIGQAAALNQAILNLTEDTSVRVGFSSIDLSLAFGVLCTDETVALVVTNRRATAAERAACEAVDQFLLEVLVAREAYVLVASLQNELIEPFTQEQARRLLTAERWADVDPRWTTDAVNRYFPSESSAELRLFEEWEAGERGLGGLENTLYSIDAADTVREIVGDNRGVGLLDYGTYLQNSDTLQLIEIEGITLSDEAITQGDYLFIQPIYLYLNRNDILEDERIVAFINYYLDTVSEVAADTGYFPISPELIVTIKSALARAEAGDLLLGETIVETAVIQPSVAVTPTVAVSETTALTATQPMTTVVAVGEQVVAPLLLTAYSRTSIPDLSISVEPLPLMQAVQRLCVEESADLVLVANANRIAEQETCAASRLLAVPAGLDGIALVLHPDNTFANALTQDELTALLFAETWSEANTNWPDEAIVKLTGDRAAYETLVDVLSGGDPNLALSLRSAEIETQAQLSQLIDTVTENPNTIGVVSYAAAQSYLGDVQLIAVDGVEISAETLRDDSYPFTRALFLYSTVEAIQNKPFVGAFLRDYLNQVEQIAPVLGFAPPLGDQTERAQSRLTTIDAPNSDE